MKKAIFLFLRVMSVFFIIAGFPVFASAGSAEITEIMYDAPGTDSGREWIEIRNTGGTDIDLSAWKLFEADTNHKIMAIGGAQVPAGSYAVIADQPDKFKADNPGFSGLLFDSAFSLGNEGEKLIIRDEGGADADAVSYIPGWGGNGDGNSLQKAVSGTWISAMPTPGSATTATVSTSPVTPAGSLGAPDNASTSTNQQDVASIDSEAAVSSHSSQEPANTSYGPPQFTISAGRPRLGLAGAPVIFQAKITAAENVFPVSGMRTSWSFGDGGEAYGENVYHAYLFPGSYAVIANSDYGSAHAVARVRVDIREPLMKITAVTPEFVEVSNMDQVEANIGGFILEDPSTRFIIPADTIILPNASLKLGKMITGIEGLTGYVRIADPLGRVLSTYAIPLYRGIQGSDPAIDLPSGFDIERFIQAFKK